MSALLSAPLELALSIFTGPAVLSNGPLAYRNVRGPAFLVIALEPDRHGAPTGPNSMVRLSPAGVSIRRFSTSGPFRA
jgi:hypothetical protein